MVGTKVFPKINGDICYAGDINKLFNLNFVKRVGDEDSVSTNEDINGGDSSNFSADDGFGYVCLSSAGTLVIDAQPTSFYSPVLKYNQAILKFHNYIFTEFDECNNSSWDTNLWESSGTPSENTERQRLDADNGYIRCKQDFYGTDELIVARFVWGNSGNGYITGKVIITDETHDVEINSAAVGSGVDDFHMGGTFYFKFDSANSQVWVWKNVDDNTANGATPTDELVLIDGSPFDLSSLTDNVWKIELAGTHTA